MADEDSILIDEMLSHLNANLPHHKSSSQVAKFYANRSVFITGATGFIGKALVEKLVWSCKDIKRIYLLIREKRGMSAKERLAQFRHSQIFDRINSLPDGNKVLKHKLRAIQGDITCTNFGISSEDMRELSQEVEIVFNSAANVRFTDPLDVAVKCNIYSVNNLTEVCHQLERLKAIVHLSTVYSNCNKQDTIYEELYESPIEGEQMTRIVSQLKQFQAQVESRSVRKQNFTELETSSLKKFTHLKRTHKDDLLNKLSEFILYQSNRPNFYILTKAISESYLVELLKRRPDRYLNDKIPLAIVRPSIVSNAWREPSVGFADKFSGPTIVVSSLYTGLIHGTYVRPHHTMDMLPMDMAANLVLCTGYFLMAERSQELSGEGMRQKNGVYIFNHCSGNQNPLKGDKFKELIVKTARKYPSKYALRPPNITHIKWERIFDLYNYFKNYWFTCIHDSVAKLIMRKQLGPSTSAVASYERTHEIMNVCRQLLSNQWDIDDANVRALNELLTPVDRDLFQFDVKLIHWDSYLQSLLIGTRINLLKDNAESLPAALRRSRKLTVFYQACQLLMVLLSYFVLFWNSALERKLLSILWSSSIDFEE